MDLTNLRIESIKVYIQKIGLTESLASQLHCILEEQFKVGTLREIAGSAFSREGKLELQIIKTSLMDKIEKSLYRFRDGDYSEINELYTFVHQAHSSYREDIGTVPELIYYLDSFFEISSREPERLQKFPDLRRKEVVEDYKELIANFSILPWSELKVDCPGFRGIFHVHDNGLKPSKIDVQNNVRTQIPDLVISATPDYVRSGAKLYLVHSGSFELLYQGLLQPAKKE